MDEIKEFRLYPSGEWRPDASIKIDSPFIVLDKSEWSLSTRLTDKSGIEICTGDIVEYEACSWVVKFGFHKVLWIHSIGDFEYAYGFYLQKQYDSDNPTRATVDEPISPGTIEQCRKIGNIHRKEK